MKGQTNRSIIHNHVQRKLRNNMTDAESICGSDCEAANWQDANSADSIHF